MKTIRIVLSIYQKLSIANFILAIQTIIDALTGNPNFPLPQPTLPTLQSLLDSLRSQAAAVKAGNLSLKPARDLSRSTLYTELQALAAYCLYTATQSSNSIEEAVTKIQSAGLVIAQPGGSIGALPAPQNPRAKSLSQAVEIEFDSVKGAHMYLIMKTDGLPTENSVWTETITPRVKHTFENIQAGHIITCKIYALGAAGKGQPSEYVSEMAGM